MNSALALGFGHSLKAVDAALELEPRISALALYHKAYFLISAELGRFSFIIFGFQPLRSAYILYIRKSKPAKRAATSRLHRREFQLLRFLVVKVSSSTLILLSALRSFYRPLRFFACHISEFLIEGAVRKHLFFPRLNRNLPFCIRGIFQLSASAFSLAHQALYSS